MQATKCEMHASISLKVMLLLQESFSVVVGAMNEFEFRSALGQVRRASFKEDRLKIARQVIRNNCVSTMQVRQMMDLMSFEDSKLRLAKFAWERVVDPQSYYLLNDAFSFSSSVRSLNSHMERNPKRILFRSDG